MNNPALRKDGPTNIPGGDESLPVLTRYDQQCFLERLNHVMHRTNHYNDTLTSAWEKIEQSSGQHVHERGVTSAIRAERTACADHLRRLLQCIQNAGITDVVLETAHAYAYQSMDDASFVRFVELQCTEAQQLAALLEENKIKVRRVLFIDNYNSNPSSGVREENLRVDEYAALARTNGFPPDYLIWEADMAPIATSMIHFMRQYQSLVVQKEHREHRGHAVACAPEGALHLEHRGVELLSLARAKVGCAALDAALCLLKYRYLGRGIINVLPKRHTSGGFSFRGQQQKVRQILMGHLGVRVMPFFNVFVSDVDVVPHSSGAHNAFRKKSH